MWLGRDPAIIRDPACIAYLIYTAPASKQDPALIWTRLINGHIRYLFPRKKSCTGVIKMCIVKIKLHTIITESTFIHPQVCYGGQGYVHLMEYIVPKMRERGISQDTINTILMQNRRSGLHLYSVENMKIL